MIREATPPAIAEAAEHIRGGELVAFPTETVYGLGADATDAAAVARIFAVKKRPSFDPIIVHAGDADGARELARQWPPQAERLAAAFWPGPLTLVLPKRERVPDIVTAGMASVGLRVPAHPVALALLDAARRPIAAPSANPFGYVSPTRAEHVAAQLGSEVALILDGGACRVGVESTILSLLGDAPVLLRPGGVTLEAIEACIGGVRTAPDAARPLAPGQLPSHYAPRTPLLLIDAISEIAPHTRSAAALLSLYPLAGALGFAHVEVLAPDGRLPTAAANLFAALRRIDAGAYARIYALRVPEVGLGRAIMDRLRRAAARPRDRS